MSCLLHKLCNPSVLCTLLPRWKIAATSQTRSGRPNRLKYFLRIIKFVISSCFTTCSQPEHAQRRICAFECLRPCFLHYLMVAGWPTSWYGQAHQECGIRLESCLWWFLWWVLASNDFSHPVFFGTKIQLFRIL